MFQGTWPVWGSAGPPSGGAWLSLAKDGLFGRIGQKEYPIIFEDYDTPMVSRNGELMMCIGGFKDTVVNHKETILEFLEV